MLNETRGSDLSTLSVTLEGISQQHFQLTAAYMNPAVVLLRYHTAALLPPQPPRGLHPTEHMQPAVSSGPGLSPPHPLPSHRGLALPGRGSSERRY